MKKLNLVLITLLIISGCENLSKVKTKNIDSAIHADTTQKYNAVTSNKENDVSALKVNTCFFSANYGEGFIYIIDEQHCLIANQLCHYTYDLHNNILKVFTIGGASEFFEGYFKVFSGRACKEELLNNGLDAGGIDKYISTNENNPSFSLMTMREDGAKEAFYLDKGYGQFLYISTLNSNPFQSKSLDNAILYLLNNLKTEVQNSEYLYLQTENKVDIIKNIGQGNVDALLVNKVDDNYNTLMKEWEKIDSEKNSIQSFLDNQQQSNVNYEVVFPSLIKTLLTYIKLDTINDNYNKKLDNEILPIVHPSEETN